MAGRSVRRPRDAYGVHHCVVRIHGPDRSRAFCMAGVVAAFRLRHGAGRSLPVIRQPRSPVVSDCDSRNRQLHCRTGRPLRSRSGTSSDRVVDRPFFSCCISIGCRGRRFDRRDARSRLATCDDRLWVHRVGRRIDVLGDCSHQSGETSVEQQRRTCVHRG